MPVTSTAPLYQQTGSRRTRKMDTIMDIKVLASGGFPWMTAEHRREEESLCDNDLQTLLDFCGPPQNVALERVKGIESNS